MHPSQLTGDGTLAGGLNFAGEWRHPTLRPRGCMVAAGAQSRMAPLSCKIEATRECPVTCELRWMHLFQGIFSLVFFQGRKSEGLPETAK